MNTKILTGLLLLAFILVLTGCQAQSCPVLPENLDGADDNATEAESIDTGGALTLSQMDGLEHYENANYGFAMSYPSDWTAQEPDPNALGIVTGFLAPGEDFDDPLDYVTVQIEKLPSDQTISLDYYTQMVLSNLNSSYPDFQSLAEGDMQLSDQPAHVLAYTVTVDQVPYQVLLAYTILNDKAYILTYNALAGRYSQYEDDAKEMINSFEYL
jgi:hypothetical protein